MRPSTLARGALAAGTLTAVAALCGCGSTSHSTTHDSAAHASTATLHAAGTTIVAHGAVQAPALARDRRSGRIYVAWGRDAGTGPYGTTTQVFLAHSDDGGRSFTGVAPVAPAADSNAYGRPSVAVTPTGAVLVLWEHAIPDKAYTNGRETLRLARSTDGGRTFTRTTVFPDHVATQTTLSSMAVSPGGRVIVGWLDYRTRLNDKTDRRPAEVRTVLSDDDGKSFSSASRLGARVSCSCCRPSFAFRDATHAVLAWRGLQSHRAYDVRDIQVADSSNGGSTFGPGHVLHADGWRVNQCPVVGPGAAFDADGRLDVGYYTGAAGRAGVWLARPSGRVVALGRGSVPSGNDVQVAEAGNRTWATWASNGTSPSGGRVRVRSVDRADRPGPELTVAGHNPQLLAAGGAGELLAYSTTSTATTTTGGTTRTVTKPGDIVVARLP